MSTKRVYILLVVLIMNMLSMSLCQGIVYANESVDLKQVYGENQYLDMFITEKLDSDTLSVKVSNKDATIDGSGVCVDEGITFRTTVLIDVSSSMPASVRSKVYDLLDTMIEGIESGEAYKIITFDESLTVLNDFTSDRYELAKAIEKIQFDGKQSIIYDAIFNTIPDISPIEEAPCFYRTLVITDGVDDTASGVTKEELFIKLQDETYPIDVIEVSKNKVDPNKNLAAINRMSHGEYHQLDSETDVKSLTGELNLNQLYWVRAVVPKELSDGSVRQINIKDNSNAVQFDTKVMVFDSEDIIENEQSSEIQENDPDENATVAKLELTSNNEKESLIILGIKLSKSLLIMASLIIVVIGIIIVVVIITASKKKKASKQQTGMHSNNATSKTNPESSYGNTMTEFIGVDNIATDNEKIEGVRLRNINNQSEVWNIKLDGDILIGRESDCKVCLSESSVSRKQCKLTKVKKGIEVTNISTSNMTLLNGKSLSKSKIIKSGDELKCGRVTLAIEFLHDMYSVSDADLNRGTEFINI